MDKQDLTNFNALKKLYVHSNNKTDANKGNSIPVSSLIDLTPPTVGQGSFTHFNRFRFETISARLAPGYSESQVIDYIKAHVPFVMTSDVHYVHYAFSGKAAQFLQSSKSMIGIISMSLIFIYLVLSAQFGSFLNPLIITGSIVCIAGGLLSLKLTDGTLSIYSQIGLVTLIGMISKHGILIT